MLKSAIRKQALADRLSLTDEAYHGYNQQLLSQFQKLDFSQVSSLHIFLPIQEKKEPDTFLMINWLQECHPEIKIIVPKADFKTAEMSNHEYKGQQSLKKNTYQIPEPVTEAVYEGKPDLVFVPLLAFDQQGYRVGYGKGFYDRFLQHANAQKIGLSLFPAVDRIDDVNIYDIQLDLCITPTEIIKFN